jgi:hypothetical protein
VFKDYLSANGENEILDWLNSLPKGAKARINTAIRFLEAMERLEMPYARVLKGNCAGLLELRILFDNVQYRPLCCYGPGMRDVTLLVGAREKGSKFEPRTACEMALARKGALTLKERTCDHDFS